MKPKQIFHNVEITDTNTEGKGIGRINNLVCFIDFAVPGDVVDIQVTHKKRSYIEAKIISFKKQSDKRSQPECKHFGICGGCKWQHLNYESQLYFKQKFVEDAMVRLAKIKTEILPIIPSQNIFYYRNKLEFTFSNRKWLPHFSLSSEKEFPDKALGFHVPKHFDKVLDIEECHLQENLSNAIRLEVKKIALENKLSFFDIKKQTGFLRNIIIRNTSIGQWMVILVFFYEQQSSIEKLMTNIQEAFPQITSLQYVINSKKNDSISDLKVEAFSGKEYIEEQIGELKFRIGPKSFFQTNTLQAYELYKTVRNFASLTNTDIVYDLYTGTGTIANFIAPCVRKTLGIEYITEAIEDARVNSQINGISNTEFFAGDIKEVLNSEFVLLHGKPNIIVTDPPRSGMHEDVVRRIMEISPEKIVYVSCNPTTQARDMAILSEKYSLVKIQPFDMFPHTAHVECVALLVRKKN